LKNIKLPEQLEYINGTVKQDEIEKSCGAFEGCESLESINVPSGVTDLTNAFRYCINLKNVTIPEGVLYMNSTFEGCTSLEVAVIPDGVGHPAAFVDCENLRSVSLPNTTKDVYMFSFKGCTRLTEITFRGTMEEWDNVKKGIDWDQDIPATVVHCTDGDVPIQ
jgi:hypothetical protein